MSSILKFFGFSGERDLVKKRACMFSWDDAGKTTFLYTLTQDSKQFKKKATIPTIGFNVETKTFANNKSEESKIEFWDVSGGCKLRELWHHYIEDDQYILWFVDASPKQWNSSRNLKDSAVAFKKLVNGKILKLKNVIFGFVITHVDDFDDGDSDAELKKKREFRTAFEKEFDLDGFRNLQRNPVGVFEVNATDVEHPGFAEFSQWICQTAPLLHPGEKKGKKQGDDDDNNDASSRGWLSCLNW